ncbi:MAG: hypothetical protein KDC26_02815 [Armatimonadetes bacterium]|nr:hypothetical protein [Armatimonadota bacterium]
MDSAQRINVSELTAWRLFVLVPIFAFAGFLIATLGFRMNNVIPYLVLGIINTVVGILALRFGSRDYWQLVGLLCGMTMGINVFIANTPGYATHIRGGVVICTGSLFATLTMKAIQARATPEEK